MITDVHTHTKFSPDGVDDIFTMVSSAKAAGVKYYGISEHFDFDIKADGLYTGDDYASYTPAEEYFSCARKIQAEENGLNLLVGGEFGYARSGAAAPLYNELIEKYNPDFIVNSVHANGASDYYYKKPYIGRNKKEAYGEYFSIVLKSLSPGYYYDTVGHLGYCSRFAPYEERKIVYSDFSREIDGILCGIIERDKILEVNSSVRGLEQLSLPDRDVIERYFSLGGRNISFASDAHRKENICYNRDKVVTMLKEIGFTYITIPIKRGVRVKAPL